MSKLYFRHGPMNSGKTIQLLSVAHNYERNHQPDDNKAVLVVKPAVDLKANESIISRIGPSRQVDILAGPETDLEHEILVRKLGGTIVECMLIDEAQFLHPFHVEQLHNIAVNDDIPVIAYGLRTDFKTRMFEGSKRLLELAHSIEEIKTVCSCNKKAIFNARKEGGVFVQEGSAVAIDGLGETTYEPLCSACYQANVGSIILSRTAELVEASDG